MAGDVQDIVRELLLNALESSGKKSSDASGSGKSDSPGALSGMKGVVAGAGAAALAPLAVKNLGNVLKRVGVPGLEDLTKAPGGALSGVTSKLGDSVGSGIGDKVSDKVDEAGGPSGMLKDAVSGALPFGGGGDDGGKGGAAGAGKGRRMPVQQSIDIGAPLETVYNQWTQFEDWPTFMHRVKRVTQEDPCTLSFAAKIWGKTKEFTAKIETQRPDERIKWKVSQGMTHTGVVTFHELGPKLTRVMLLLDVEPGSLIEKAARGMRHVKRAARGDLHRFAALIEMAENETGAWRGVIEDGELVEDHDPSYDEQREYSDLDDLVDSDEEEGDEDQDEDEEQEQDGEARGESEDDEGDDEDEQENSEEPEESRPRSRARRQNSRNGSQEDDEQPKRGRGRSGSRASSEGSGSRSRAASGGGRSSQATSSRSRGAKSGSSSDGKSKASKSQSGGRSRSSGSKSGSSGGRSSASSSGRSGSSRGASSSQSSGRRSRSRSTKS